MGNRESGAGEAVATAKQGLSQGKSHSFSEARGSGMGVEKNKGGREAEPRPVACGTS